MDIAGRKLLLIFGKTSATSFVIVPGWYVGNEKYDRDRLTAVDVELVDQLDQPRVEEVIRRYLEEKGFDLRISFWGAAGFPFNSESLNSAAADESRKAKILVVDDDPGIRKIINMHLEKEGYTVQMASGADQAIDMIKNERDALPNLMLLDIMMPGDSGWQLLKDLENDPKASKIPVVAISGLEKPAQGQEYDSKMLYDYLVKPFSMEELSRVIRKFSRL
jgi:CheY-like chemotaxis protein